MIRVVMGDECTGERHVVFIQLLKQLAHSPCGVHQHAFSSGFVADGVHKIFHRSRLNLSEVEFVHGNTLLQNDVYAKAHGGKNSVQTASITAQ